MKTPIQQRRPASHWPPTGIAKLKVAARTNCNLFFKLESQNSCQGSQQYLCHCKFMQLRKLFATKQKNALN